MSVVDQSRGAIFLLAKRTNLASEKNFLGTLISCRKIFLFGLQLVFKEICLLNIPNERQFWQLTMALCKKSSFVQTSLLRLPHLRKFFQPMSSSDSVITLAFFQFSKLVNLFMTKFQVLLRKRRFMSKLVCFIETCI